MEQTNSPTSEDATKKIDEGQHEKLVEIRKLASDELKHQYTSLIEGLTWIYI